MPTSLDFTGTPKPAPQTQSATLIEGTGATVEKGQSIAVNYLGQVYEGKKPFDESYSKGQPAAFSIGTGGVVPGWDKTLVGVKVGSRVVISIPPDGRVRRAGQPAGRDQGHRHAVLRGRHPRRRLTTGGMPRWRATRASGCSTC